VDLVSNLGLEVHDNPSPYLLGWVNKDIYSKVTNQCNIKFVVIDYLIYEEDLDVLPLYVCGVVFRIPYMYMRNVVFMRRAKWYCLIKDDKSFIINTHKGK